MLTYWQERRDRNRNYYDQATSFVRKYAADAASMIDIGNRGCEYIYEWDWIADRTVLDIGSEIFELDDSVKKIQHDFLTWQPDRQYDLVTCLQTLEHLQDPAPFVAKLHQIQKDVLIVSLPYMWPADMEPVEHHHDPIGISQIHSWLGTGALEEMIVKEQRGTARWIGVYAKLPHRRGSRRPSGADTSPAQPWATASNE